MKDTTFLISTYKEKKSIEILLNDIKLAYSRSKIIFIDNNSNDNTLETAKRAGVKLLHEQKQGKGGALKKGFENVKSKFALILDDDNTYFPFLFFKIHILQYIFINPFLHLKNINSF